MNKQQLVEGKIPPLSEDRRRALILYYLYQAVGQEELTAGALARACAAASGHSVSTYQVENELTKLVGNAFVWKIEGKTEGGRKYKRYAIDSAGVVLLYTYLRQLPKILIDTWITELDPIGAAAMRALERRKKNLRNTSPGQS